MPKTSTADNSTQGHLISVEPRWNGWRVWCSTCSDYGIYDNESTARTAADEHIVLSAANSVTS